MLGGKLMVVIVGFLRGAPPWILLDPWGRFLLG